MDLLRPLFKPTHPAPPVDLEAARSMDLRFLSAVDVLIDTPSMELFFELLAAFPEARVIITARDALQRHRLCKVADQCSPGRDAPTVRHCFHQYAAPLWRGKAVALSQRTP